MWLVGRCVDAAVRAMGIRRVPELFPPVAYSRLPTRSFTKGIDTGLVFQVSVVIYSVYIKYTPEQ